MLNIPPRLNELWDWFSAVWAFDYGDARPLSDLIKSNEGAIPAEFASAVADIVSGARRPNKKAGVKLLVPARELGKLSGTLMILCDLRDKLKTGATEAAYRNRMKPIDVIEKLNRRIKIAKGQAMSEFGLGSEETIDRLLREYKDRVTKWPVV